jgi:hypothetical protein
VVPSFATVQGLQTFTTQSSISRLFIQAFSCTAYDIPAGYAKVGLDNSLWTHPVTLLEPLKITYGAIFLPVIDTSSMTVALCDKLAAQTLILLDPKVANVVLESMLKSTFVLFFKIGNIIVQNVKHLNLPF